MKKRIETTLMRALEQRQAQAPPLLAQALEYALFPGGARLRPQLCLAVANALGEDDPILTDHAAAALELLHCASLVHDDLPCFDDANLRRGKPSVHRAFGEPVALLTGDALIVMAFELLAEAGGRHPDRALALVARFGRAAGTPFGLVAGQAWESEVTPDRRTYHQAKTGALFTAATCGGALCAGADPEPWRVVGARLGEAYQVADDLLDRLGARDESGKLPGRDQELDRPSAVADLGISGALELLEELVASAAAAVPHVEGAETLRALVRAQAKRLVPAGVLTAA